MITLPAVKSLRLKEGAFAGSEAGGSVVLGGLRDERLSLAAQRLVGVLREAGWKDPALAEADRPGLHGIFISVDNRSSASESYRLAISPDDISITGSGPAGVFYGIQTLIQIVRQQGTTLPCCDIEDAPDFPHRGFLHDVTRGKVPTLATLKMLVEKASFYKINQLQLYVEHSFAFRSIPELGRGKDPLTPSEIRELDAWCWMHFIDLVPCLSTFGHLYELLRIPRFERLNELSVNASSLPVNLWDRMAHYTIDASNPESAMVIRNMLDDFLPLFQSRYCNICADETFDLGAGKNALTAAATGKGRLYVEFIRKTIAVVREHGKTPMMWGDIILHYPELLGELPGDLVYLNWGYARDVSDAAAKTFAAHGVRQYLCPGVQGWSRFASDIDAASANIRSMVRYGRENRAEGVLTTDWGDCGHVNFPSFSWHGMGLGAALSWNGESFADDRAYDEALSLAEWRDASGRTAVLLRELGGLCPYHFGNLYAWAYGVEGLWNREKEITAMDAGDLSQRFARASAIVGELAGMKNSGIFAGSAIDLDEFICGGRAVRWTLSLIAFKKRREFGQASCPELYGSTALLLKEGRAVLEEFERLWRVRNKESELVNVRNTFHKIFAKIILIDIS
jgi:hypothetical protein